MDNDLRVGHPVDMLLITLQSVYRELDKNYYVISSTDEGHFPFEPSSHTVSLGSGT